MKRVDLTFWNASVRHHGYERQLAAASAGGFDDLVMSTATFRDALKAGYSLGDVKEMAEESGLALRILDPITAWSGVRYPGFLEGDMRTLFDTSVEECLEMAEALGVESVVAFPGFAPGEVAPDAVVRGFADLCDRAAPLGLWVELEFMPAMGVATLADAYSLVRAAGRSNAGIVLDTWHYARGGLDLELLRAIPGEWLRTVQIGDGFHAQRGRDLIDDALHHRAFPGEGELPAAEILAIVAAKGHLRSVGAETFSAVAYDMEPLEVGRREGQALRRVLDQVGVAYG